MNWLVNSKGFFFILKIIVNLIYINFVLQFCDIKNLEKLVQFTLEKKNLQKKIV
jgi:hypothetical protein